MYSDNGSVCWYEKCSMEWQGAAGNSDRLLRQGNSRGEVRLGFLAALYP